jgi:hypothetical protein
VTSPSSDLQVQSGLALLSVSPFSQESTRFSDACRSVPAAVSKHLNMPAISGVSEAKTLCNLLDPNVQPIAFNAQALRV